MLGKLACPNCHANTISGLRKLCLGPATYATCSACGAHVSVPVASLFATAPFIAAVLLTMWSGSILISAAALIAGFLAMAFLHIQYVPLVTK